MASSSCGAFSTAGSRPRTAGAVSTSPVGAKREPWQGQSQLSSTSFQCTRHPRCVQTAEKELAARGNAGAVAPLAQGLTAVRSLRRDLAGMGLSEDARFEIDFRLAQKESQFIAALVAATDMRIEAVANDGVVTPGQQVGVQLIAVARGTVPVEVKIGLIDRLMQGRMFPLTLAGLESATRELSR